LLYRLFEGYEREGLIMPYTLEDFRRDFVRAYLSQLTPEQPLQGLSSEEVLKLLPREAIEDYLKRQPNGSSSAPPQDGGQPN
jgi:hypothetical protein